MQEIQKEVAIGTDNRQQEQTNAMSRLSEFIIQKEGKRIILKSVITSGLLIGIGLLLVLKTLVGIGFFLHLISFFVLGGLVIASIDSLGNSIKNMRYGSNYPEQQQIYFPFDKDFYGVIKSPEYQESKQNPKIAYTDPLYINKVVPRWTSINTIPNYVNRIPAFSEGQKVSGLFYAIMLITISTKPKGKLLFRVFIINTTNHRQSHTIKYTHTQPGNGLIDENRIITLTSRTVGPNQVNYKDVTLSTTSSIEGLHDIFIIDSWEVERKVGNQNRKVRYQQIRSFLRYFVISSTVGKSMNFWLDTMIQYSLHQNPFVSPSGTKEIILYLISNGSFNSEETYQWRQNLNFSKLVFGLSAIIPVIVGILAIFLNGFRPFFYVLLLIFGIFMFWMLLRSILVMTPEVNKQLYEMGLASSPNYVSYRDISIYEENDDVFRILSIGEKNQKSVPIGFAIDFSQITSTNNAEWVLKRENEKTQRLPQYQYRLKQINLPALYHLPYFEDDLMEMKFEFTIDIPDLHVDLFSAKTDERMVKFIEPMGEDMQCTNCGMHLDIVFEYCQYCSSEIQN